MEEILPGAYGSGGSLFLRMGQSFFGFVSLLSMCLGVEFYNYTTFCFLVAIMGLVVPWSLTLALVDIFSITVKTVVRPPGILSVVIFVDWVLAFLSLAASSSTASVTNYMVAMKATSCLDNLCVRYEVAAASAFLTWFLLFASALFNLWILPSV